MLHGAPPHLVRRAKSSPTSNPPGAAAKPVPTPHGEHDRKQRAAGALARQLYDEAENFGFTPQTPEVQSISMDFSYAPKKM